MAKKTPKVGDLVTIVNLTLNCKELPGVWRRKTKEEIDDLVEHRHSRGIFQTDDGETFIDIPLQILDWIEVEKLSSATLIVTSLSPHWQGFHPKPAYLREAKDPTTGNIYLFSLKNCEIIASDKK